MMCYDAIDKSELISLMSHHTIKHYEVVLKHLGTSRNFCCISFTDLCFGVIQFSLMGLKYKCQYQFYLLQFVSFYLFQ